MSSTDSPGDGYQKPIILDGQQPQAPAYGPAPGAITMKQPSRLHAGIRGTVAGVLIVCGILNLAFSSGFPSAAPVESIYVLALSIDMFLAAVALIIFAVLAASRRSVPVLPDRTSPLSVAALALAVVPLLAWLLFALLPTIADLSAGNAVRYMTEVGILVLFGIPWILSIVFGAISLRSGGRRTNLFGGLALGIGLLLVVPVLVATILYSAGLTA